ADVRSDLFVTIFYVVLDAFSAQLSFANAGHNPPLLVRAARPASEYLTQHGMALGVMPNVTLTEQSLTLEAGDVLVLYTDGVTEALNEAGEEFGLERLERSVIDSLGGSPDDIVQEVKNALRAYVGDEPPFDDMTMVVVKRVNG
ncbi:MAG: PP2C family protein-serine/threonine phosphatase, partial [Vicinamibacterales bacterium]